MKNWRSFFCSAVKGMFAAVAYAMILFFCENFIGLSVNFLPENSALLQLKSERVRVLASSVPYFEKKLLTVKKTVGLKVLWNWLFFVLSFSVATVLFFCLVLGMDLFI